MPVWAGLGPVWVWFVVVDQQSPLGLVEWVPVWAEIPVWVHWVEVCLGLLLMVQGLVRELFSYILSLFL